MRRFEKTSLLISIVLLAGSASLGLAQAEIKTCFDPHTGKNVEATIKGTNNNDKLDGTSKRDVIWAGKGNDKITSGAGSDIVCAGDGSDYVDAGDGFDVIDGEAGEDILLGDKGYDFIYGGGDRDLLDGGEGLDTLYGMAADDKLQGGFGADRLFGGVGNDTLNGQDNTDILEGNENNDTIICQDRDYDSVSYLLAPGKVLVDLSYGKAGWGASSGAEGQDLISEYCHIIGSNYNDYLEGSIGPNHIEGGGGNDIIVGEDGLKNGSSLYQKNYLAVDFLAGNSGDDAIYGSVMSNQDESGEDGPDLIYGDWANIRYNERFGGGNDQLFGQGGEDVLVGENGNDVLNGGADADKLRDQIGGNVFNGGAQGDDCLSNLTKGTGFTNQITNCER